MGLLSRAAVKPDSPEPAAAEAPSSAVLEEQLPGEPVLDAMENALRERLKRLPRKKTTPYTALSLFKAYGILQTGICLALQEDIYSSYASVGLGIGSILIPKEKIWSPEKSGEKYLRTGSGEDLGLRKTENDCDYWILPLCLSENNSAEPWKAVMIFGVSDSAFRPETVTAILDGMADEILTKPEPESLSGQTAAEKQFPSESSGDNEEAETVDPIAEETDSADWLSEESHIEEAGEEILEELASAESEADEDLHEEIFSPGDESGGDIHEEVILSETGETLPDDSVSGNSEPDETFPDEIISLEPDSEEAVKEETFPPYDESEKNVRDEKFPPEFENEETLLGELEGTASLPAEIFPEDGIADSPEEKIAGYHRQHSGFNCILLDVPAAAHEEMTDFCSKVSEIITMPGAVIPLPSGRPLILLPKNIDRELVAHRLSKTLKTNLLLSFEANSPEQVTDSIRSLTCDES